MNIEWKNVDIELINKNKNRKEKHIRLISNANGIVKAGSLCAIMGPSGSGKTTLIKTLVGRIPSGSRTRGEILANGKQRDYQSWCKIIGYVDQDDCIYENLTVFETVEYAAKFRLKDQDINLKKKIEDLLYELDILDISGSKMNSISGGERKRVMIAIEIVTEPNVLFMDEPTSGLDASTAFNLVKLMKDLTISRKMSVIFTIHQPSTETYAIFDQLILLSDSYTVFSGEAKNAEEYFESFGLKKRELSTFPDFLVEILKAKKKYQELPENQSILAKMIEDADKRYPKTEKNIFSNKNTISIGYLPSYKEISILLHRRYRINLSFTRIITILTFFIVFFIAFYKPAFSMLNLNENISFVGGFIRELTEKGKVSKYDQFLQYIKIYPDEISKVFKSSFFANFLNMLFAYTMIVSTGLFSQEYRMVKRELGVATYSIGSYYIATFLFELLCYFPMFVMSGVLIFFLGNNEVSWIVYVFLIFGGLGYLPVILFFGSLTKRTKTIYAIIGFLALTWIITPMIYSLLHHAAEIYENPIIRNLIRIFSIFPPIHYNFLGFGITYKLCSNGSDFLKINTKVKEACDAFATDLYSYLYYSMSVWHIALFFLATTFACIGLTFLALTLRLKPELRYQLSK